MGSRWWGAFVKSFCAFCVFLSFHYWLAGVKAEESEPNFSVFYFLFINAWSGEKVDTVKYNKVLEVSVDFN